MLTATGRSCKDNCFPTHVPAFESNWRHLRVRPLWDRPNGLSDYLWFVVLGIVLCVLIAPAAAEQPNVKNVLVLHNWANLPQSWDLMESTVRARVPGQI